MKKSRANRNRAMMSRVKRRSKRFPSKRNMMSKVPTIYLKKGGTSSSVMAKEPLNTPYPIPA